ncbi:MAG: XdhC family protein [Archangiaceae bacterium]|nr:XdhC family protein [Archangiaceae bacterium]
MELFQDIAKLVEEGRAFVLATVVDASGSTPQKPGSKMVVLHGGERRGTVGGGAIEQQVVEAALALLDDASAQSKLIETHLTHDLGMCCGGKMRVFLEKHGAASHLWVFGAGHVARELAALAVRVGFRVHVVDERAEWAAELARMKSPMGVAIGALTPAEIAVSIVGELIATRRGAALSNSQKL